MAITLCNQYLSEQKIKTCLLPVQVSILCQFGMLNVLFVAIREETLNHTLELAQIKN